MSQALRFARRWVFTLLHSLFLFTLGVLFPAWRKKLLQIARIFRVEPNPDELAYLDFEIPSLWPPALFDLNSFRLAHAHGIDGNVSLLELLCLLDLCRQRDPKRLFEIGTFNGRTALNLALNTSVDAVIFTLDLDPSKDSHRLSIEEAEKKFVDKPMPGELVLKSDLPEKKKIRQLLGDSAHFNYKPYEKSMDLVFIDGSHHYEYIRSDTEKAMTMVKPGGLILWHDYNPGWPGSFTYLNQFARICPGGRLYYFEGTSLAVWETPESGLGADSGGAGIKL